MDGEKPRGRGRPTKDARNAAVFLAWVLRTEGCGESRSSAQEWIREHWQFRGLGSDKREVRRALEFAERRGLRQALIVRHGDMLTAVELPPSRQIIEGSRTWSWAPGMHEAAEGRARNVRGAAVLPSLLANARPTLGEDATQAVRRERNRQRR